MTQAMQMLCVAIVVTFITDTIRAQGGGSGDCEALREQMKRSAEARSGRTLVPTGRPRWGGGGPGYKVGWVAGKVGGKSAEEIDRMSCEEIFALANEHVDDANNDGQAAKSELKEAARRGNVWLEVNGRRASMQETLEHIDKMGYGAAKDAASRYTDWKPTPPRPSHDGWGGNGTELPGTSARSGTGAPDSAVGTDGDFQRELADIFTIPEVSSFKPIPEISPDWQQESRVSERVKAHLDHHYDGVDLKTGREWENLVDKIAVEHGFPAPYRGDVPELPGPTWSEKLSEIAGVVKESIAEEVLGVVKQEGVVFFSGSDTIRKFAGPIGRVFTVFNVGEALAEAVTIALQDSPSAEDESVHERRIRTERLKNLLPILYGEAERTGDPRYYDVIKWGIFDLGYE